MAGNKNPLRLTLAVTDSEGFTQISGLSLHEGAFKVLRDVNHEVAHALVLVDDVHVVDAGLIVVGAVLDVLNHRVAEVVAQTIEALLGHHGIEEGGYPTAKS